MGHTAAVMGVSTLDVSLQGASYSYPKPHCVDISGPNGFYHSVPIKELGFNGSGKVHSTAPLTEIISTYPGEKTFYLGGPQRHTVAPLRAFRENVISIDMMAADGANGFSLGPEIHYSSLGVFPRPQHLLYFERNGGPPERRMILSQVERLQEPDIDKVLWSLKDADYVLISGVKDVKLLTEILVYCHRKRKPVYIAITSHDFSTEEGKKYLDIVQTLGATTATLFFNSSELSNAFGRKEPKSKEEFHIAVLKDGEYLTRGAISTLGIMFHCGPYGLAFFQKGRDPVFASNTGPFQQQYVEPALHKDPLIEHGMGDYTFGFGSLLLSHFHLKGLPVNPKKFMKSMAKSNARRMVGQLPKNMELFDVAERNRTEMFELFFREAYSHTFANPTLARQYLQWAYEALGDNTSASKIGNMERLLRNAKAGIGVKDEEKAKKVHLEFLIQCEIREALQHFT